MLAYRGFYSLNDKTFEATCHAGITSTTVMVNGYYDFSAGGVRPYIGAGIGWARNETDRLVQDFGPGFSNTFSGATRDDYVDLGKFETRDRCRLRHLQRPDRQADGARTHARRPFLEGGRKIGG